MTLSLTAAASLADLDTPLLVLALAKGVTATGEFDPANKATGGALARALNRRDFRGGRDETLHLAGGDKGIQRVLLVGMGAEPADRPAALRRAASIAARQANRMCVGSLAFFAGKLDATEAEAVGSGLITGAWQYREMQAATPAEDERTPLASAAIILTSTD